MHKHKDGLRRNAWEFLLLCFISKESIPNQGGVNIEGITEKERIMELRHRLQHNWEEMVMCNKVRLVFILPPLWPSTHGAVKGTIQKKKKDLTWLVSDTPVTSLQHHWIKLSFYSFHHKQGWRTRPFFVSQAALILYVTGYFSWAVVFCPTFPRCGGRKNSINIALIKPFKNIKKNSFHIKGKKAFYFHFSFLG